MSNIVRVGFRIIIYGRTIRIVDKNKKLKFQNKTKVEFSPSSFESLGGRPIISVVENGAYNARVAGSIPALGFCPERH